MVARLVKLRVVCAVLVTCAVAVLAQAPPAPQWSTEPPKAGASAPTPDSDTQKHQPSLRASLKLQLEGTAHPVEPVASRHQMSPQQRADLRRQLRQQ